MKTLKLSKGLSLPVDAITQTFLIVGKRGSGKSNTAARLVEQFHYAKLPFVVLDPADTWYGLRSSRDGTGPGLDVYVFGGRKADLPLEPGGGALIAEVLCEHRISMVLSVKHLSGRQRSDFMVAFAQTLFQKWTGGPLHVVLEEAHELAPQSIQQGRDGEQQMLGAFKRLWKLGRSSGIGGTAVTQRPASLSKDITTQSEILIAHRTIGPQDVKAIGEWVKYHGQHETILGELPSLPTGQAFVWAPEFPEGHPLGLQRTSILLRDTYDSASTPKVGEQRVEPKELADVDLEKLRTKMAATIEKAKAEDPKELKKQLAEALRMLARQSATIGQLQAAPVNEKRVDKPILTDADRALIEKLASAVAERTSLLQQSLDGHDTHTESMLKVSLDRHRESTAHLIALALGDVEKVLSRANVKKLLEKLHGLAVVAPAFAGGRVPGNSQRTSPPPASPNRALAERSRSQVAAGQQVNGGVDLTPAKQKILNALAFLAGIGVTPADKTQLALIVGVSPTSGGYFNNLGALRSTGLIEYPSGGTVALTDAGTALASTDGIPSTTQELHEAIRAKVPPAKWKILEALIPIYPNALPKDALAEQIGVSPTSGGYFNNLGSLRSLGLIGYPRPSEVAALPVLFLEA